MDKVDQVVLVLAEVVEGKVGLPRGLDLLKSSTSEDFQNVQILKFFMLFPQLVVSTICPTVLMLNFVNFFGFSE